MAKTTDKLPPQNLEAEASTLGSLLIDKDAIVSVADILEPADFYSDNNGQIYESMMALYEDRTPIDVLSLGSKLQEKGILEAVGGHTYLTELANSVPTASNVVHYAKIVQRKSTLRKLLKSASEISQLAYQESDDIEEVLDKSESKLFSVSQKFYKQVFNWGMEGQGS